MNASTNELDQLFPTGTVVKLSRDQLTLFPLKMGQLPAMLRAVSGFAGALQLGASDTSAVNWLGILSEHGDALLDAIAIGCGKARAWVDGLAPDDALLLIAKVIEINADFFAQAVLPKIETMFQSELAAKLKAAKETNIGLASSKP